MWSDEDEEFVAACPSFPGLSAYGETEEEALKEAKLALELFIESYQERGISLPEPHKAQQYSGQISLRLPKSLHRQSARMANDDVISLNQFLVNATQAKVSGIESSSQAIKDLKVKAVN